MYSLKECGGTHKLHAMGSLLTIPTIKFDHTKTITGKERLIEIDDEKNKLTGWVFYVLSWILVALLIAITLIRSTEIIAYLCDSLMYVIMFAACYLAAASLFFAPPKSWGLAIRRLGVIVMVLTNFKRDIDWDLGKDLISYSADEGGKYDLKGRIVIVTGASSGVGLGTSQLFASYGATVIMACRNKQRCKTASEHVRRLLAAKTSYIGPVIPMQMDLSDLTSVYNFANQITKTYTNVDILVNNAGSVPEPGERTQQGFEMAWGSMHLGHFALTQWLLPVLLAPLPASTVNSCDEDEDAEFSLSSRFQAKILKDEYSHSDSSRVIFVASEAFLGGSYHESLLYGNGTGMGDLHGEYIDNCGFNAVGIPCCPIGKCTADTATTTTTTATTPSPTSQTNSYARSKLSNVLSAYELQKRVDAYALSRSKEGAGAGAGAGAGGKHNITYTRRLVSSSLHPGAVATNIHPVFSSKLSNWGMRSHMQAARVIVYAAMENSYVPSSYIDSMSKPHDLFDYFASGSQVKSHHTAAASAANDGQAHGIAVHFEAWPESKKLPFFNAAKNELHHIVKNASTNAPPAGVDNPSFPKWAIKKNSFIHRDISLNGTIAVYVQQFASNFPMSMITVLTDVVYVVIDTLLNILDKFDFIGILVERRAILITTEKRNVAAISLQQVTASARLWEVSDNIVQAFEQHMQQQQQQATEKTEACFTSEMVPVVSNSSAGLRI